MTDALCHCGRPYRHDGHHWGPNSRRRPGNEKRKPGRPNNKSLFQLVCHEIERCQATLRDTAGQIEQMQAAIKDAEARLPHLIALRDVSQPPAPKPESVAAKPKPAPKPVAVVTAVPAPTIEAVADEPKLCHCGLPRAHQGRHLGSKLPPKVVVPEDTRTEADFASVEATSHEVGSWAAQHSVNFRTWDDLPGVNAVREDMELPTFKRSFAKTRTAA